MSQSDGVRRVGEIEEFKALAHPLRARLLGALREHGPATATELAHRFATDTGSTSYHLRKLEQYGFIAEAGDPGHPRARRWQAVHHVNDWSAVDMAATAEGREASAVMRRQQVDILIRDVVAYEAALSTLPSEWVDASGVGDLLARLTPASVNTLWERFYAHVDELVAQDAGDPAARPVSIVVAGLPRLGDKP
ncbi:winged helix-turn-helix domain-containing protein [Catellatospora sichuanensis]|uniref:winged helix-turn-helix domain-containing protein n=1 Tax=Catellatospora sichuanensis TaxID=1969805 RepID=UPI001183E918|nr:helix-turn-helix domain-containing protein [Catellatospora sichuanensis]